MKPVRVILIFLLVLGAAVIIYGPLYSQYRDLRSRHEKLTLELGDVRRQIAELEREKYLLENDMHHLEKVLREELGLARPGEEVYKVEEVESTVTPDLRKLNPAD
ncbi:MAG: septum formation initiator family protein [Candidatus Omnitrophica bacterium]|nr:septum formation initiator family protein [Candidatus Omnitrophota bacterium]